MTLTQKVVKQITPFMKTKGFLRKGNMFFYFANDIAFCIGFEMPSGLVYVTAYIMPLYIPSECINYAYSTRLNDTLWSPLSLLNKMNCNEDILKQWCADFYKCMDAYVLPLYKQMQNPKRMLPAVQRGLLFTPVQLCMTPLDCARLKMYTHLYWGNYAKFTSSANAYRRMLMRCKHYTAEYCQSHIAEIDKLETLTKENEQAVADYLAGIIEETKKLFETKPQRT